ncbi:MAG: 2Fe-2S iron-sulfur cluster-binding protein, partial [Anaerolineae bacterium]
MQITLKINGEDKTFQVAAGDLLLHILRREGYFGAKHGCEDGSCGACTVLVDGVPRTSCTMLAAQADGAELTTIEAVAGIAREGHGPSQGWRGNVDFHPIQQAFVETGAIQCGYCTPAMVLASKVLLETEPNPTEAQVRDALSGVLCRCTGYVKPVQAVLRAAAALRGEDVPPIGEYPRGEGDAGIPVPPGLFEPPSPTEEVGPPEPVGGGEVAVKTTPMPTMVVVPEADRLRVVGKPEPKVDATKLVQGKPAFAADVEMRGMLIGKLLRSPYAHARIRRIDASQARALPGVHAVLTYEDVPRVAHSTAGQSHPIPGPQDSFSFDTKVRYVGDRVAAVAAETEEIAEEALRLIEVDYEVLPAIFDPRDALDNPVRIHDEPDYVSFAHSNPKRNLAAQLRIDLGDVDQAIQEADHVFEAEYAVQRVQQAPI